MSATNPVPASTMDKKPYEPSMEEILASIRRIIADDQSIPGHGAAQRASLLRGAVAPADEPGVSVVQARHEPEPVASHPPERPIEPGFRETVDGRAAAQPTYDGGVSVADHLEEQRRPDQAYGSVNAPQYPMPGGPIREHHAAEAAAQRGWATTPASDPIPFHAPARTAPHVDELDPPMAAASSYDPPRDEHQAPPADNIAPASVADFEDHDDEFAEPEDDEAVYDEPLVTQADEPQDAPHLFSAATDTAISSAFNMLAASRLADNSDELKSMVREMIRPLLRSWLDDNLPSMVERMVRAEIERVARGGR